MVGEEKYNGSLEIIHPSGEVDTAKKLGSHIAGIILEVFGINVFVYLTENAGLTDNYFAKISLHNVSIENQRQATQIHQSINDSRSIGNLLYERQKLITDLTFSYGSIGVKRGDVKKK